MITLKTDGEYKVRCQAYFVIFVIFRAQNELKHIVQGISVQSLVYLELRKPFNHLHKGIIWLGGLISCPKKVSKYWAIYRKFTKAHKAKKKIAKKVDQKWQKCLDLFFQIFSSTQIISEWQKLQSTKKYADYFLCRRFFTDEVYAISRYRSPCIRIFSTDCAWKIFFLFDTHTFLQNTWHSEDCFSLPPLSPSSSSAYSRSCLSWILKHFNIDITFVT